MFDILQKKRDGYPMSHQTQLETIEQPFKNQLKSSGLWGLLLTTSIAITSCSDNASDQHQSPMSHTDSQVSRDATGIDDARIRNDAAIHTDTSLSNNNAPHGDAGSKNDASIDASFSSDADFIEDSQISKNDEIDETCTWELIFFKSGLSCSRRRTSGKGSAPWGSGAPPTSPGAERGSEGGRRCSTSKRAT